VHRLLCDLRQRPRPPVLGLLTGNIRLGAEIKLRRYALWDEFAMGAFGDDDEDRNQIAVIASVRGSQWLGRKLRGEEMLVVGDTPRDIECARAIGARMLAVATGGASWNQLHSHQPDRLVSSLEEVATDTICS
jgi:phosphoglycolate phosphatase-like HAD superfamily hydrolase